MVAEFTAGVNGLSTVGADSRTQLKDSRVFEQATIKCRQRFAVPEAALRAVLILVLEINPLDDLGKF